MRKYTNGRYSRFITSIENCACLNANLTKTRKSKLFCGNKHAVSGVASGYSNLYCNKKPKYGLCFRHDLRGMGVGGGWGWGVPQCHGGILKYCKIKYSVLILGLCADVVTSAILLCKNIRAEVTIDLMHTSPFVNKTTHTLAGICYGSIHTHIQAKCEHHKY